MRVYPAANNRSIELKVWEEPEEGSVYVVAVDPAYGANEHNDRSAIEIFKCYADGIDQVAEYASPLVRTDQFAWVIAMLMGWYGCGDNEVRYILEINGPGSAVFNELKSLRRQVENVHRKGEMDEPKTDNDMDDWEKKQAAILEMICIFKTR
jgi:hypothetical protein